MKRGGLDTTIHWGPIFLVFLALALVAELPQNELTGAIIYQDAGYGYGGGGYFGGRSYFGGGLLGGFSFLEFYENYSSFVDAILFLLIFLGVGKTVLGKHFKGAGNNAMYAGVGLILAFSLLLWEERTGISILEQTGPYAGLLFALILIVVIYRFMKQAGATALFSCSLIYLVLYFTVLADQATFAGGIIGHLIKDPDLLWLLNEIWGLLVPAAFILLLWSGISAWRRRGARPVAPIGGGP